MGVGVAANIAICEDGEEAITLDSVPFCFLTGLLGASLDLRPSRGDQNSARTRGVCGTSALSIPLPHRSSDWLSLT